MNFFPQARRIRTREEHLRKFQHRISAAIDTAGRANLAALLFGVVFLLVVTFLVIGNYNLRLAQVHDDNGAIFYSYLFTHAREFIHDPLAYPALHWPWGTICFWFPVLAGKYLGLDPRIPDYLFYVLQVFLIGLSILVLTWQVSRSWLTAFASMALALAIQPWGWNLAAYGAVIDMPFYTTLAEALATLAGAAFLARRWNLSWLLALVTAMVHPVIACYLLAMLACWAGLNRAEWRDWVSPSSAVKFAALLAVCGSPFLIKLGITEPLLSPREQWVSVSKHMHSVPWGNSGLFRILATRVLGFLLVAACCWRQFAGLPRDQRRFLLAVAGGTLILGAIQVTGVFLKMPSVALTMGLRAFSNLIVFTWPFLFSFLFSRAFLGRFSVALTLLLLALVWYRVESGIPVFNLLLFALAVFLPENFAPRRLPLYLVLVAALPLGFMTLRHTRWIYPPAPDTISLTYYLGSLLACTVIADLLTLKPMRQPLRVCATAGLLALSLVRAEAIGEQTRGPAAAALYDVELWARDHTAPGTMFISNVGWRSLSERPAAMLTPVLSEEIYTPLVSIRARNQALLQLYGIGGSWRAMSIEKIIAASQAGYLRLTGKDFTALSQEFGAPYLVRPKTEAALDFPIAYQNAGYRIYRVGNP